MHPDEVLGKMIVVEPLYWIFQYKNI